MIIDEARNSPNFDGDAYSAIARGLEGTPQHRCELHLEADREGLQLSTKISESRPAPNESLQA